MTVDIRDRNCLSYWFPKLEKAGLPVPETKIVKTDLCLHDIIDGRSLNGFEEFFSSLKSACLEMGLPCFLRTGHTSDKHNWKYTCCVSKISRLANHIYNLVEFSAIADFIGLPTNVWVVRKMLPTKPVLTAFRGIMPICREFRVFVSGSTYECMHPYWPKEALAEGFDEIPRSFQQKYVALCSLWNTEEKQVIELAREAGHAVGGGSWSVDVISTINGWYITDMADAEQSYHWKGCPKIKDDD